jgi:hypothetical protein
MTMTGTTAGGGQFDIGRVVRHTFGAIAHNAGSFAILSIAFAGVPTLIWSLGLGQGVALMRGAVRGGAAPDLAMLGTDLLLVLGGFVVSIVASAILQGAIVYGAACYLNGRPASLDDCLATGLKRCLPLVGLEIVAGVAIAFGFMLFFVPGIMMFVAWSVAVPALVVERTGVFGGLGRSAELTRGRRWAVFGLLFLVWVAVLIVGQLAQAVFGLIAPVADPAVQTLRQLPLSGVIGLVVSVVTASGYAALYYELRSAREGVGPEALAAVFD